MPMQWRSPNSGTSSVRIAASLKARTAPAHVVLQRLTSSGPSDRVAKALTALGRLVKTRNILRYLHDEPLRLRIQTQLNRGEARHGLARWLFFADQGEFRTSDFEMIMNKARPSLLSNAVVLWNTLQLERIVTELRASGTTIRDEDLAHVWPLQRRHITPNGVYFANRTMPAFVLRTPSKPDHQPTRRCLIEGSTWRAIRYRIKSQRRWRHTKYICRASR